jgi:hypothetical protein
MILVRTDHPCLRVGCHNVVVGVHTYRDGMPRVGVLAPCAQLGPRSSVERKQRLGFHVVACMRLYRSPGATPHIYRAR